MDREKIIENMNIAKAVLCNPNMVTPEMSIKIGQTISDAISLQKEQEPKTGHWVSVDDGSVVAIDNDGYPERACFCSECKKYLTASDEYAVYGKYCPFCGAKMEGW